MKTPPPKNKPAPANKFKIERHQGREISHEVNSDDSGPLSENELIFSNQTKVQQNIIKSKDKSMPKLALR
jgi:hypothetical protein